MAACAAVPGERLLRTDAGLGLLESFLGQRLACGLVGGRGFGFHELYLNELIQHLPIYHVQVLGRHRLAAAGQLGFEADDLVVQHGAGDLNALALGHHGVGEERIGFDSRRGGGGGCLRRLVRRGAPGGNGRRQQEGHGKS